MRVAIVRGGVVDTVVVADSPDLFAGPEWADWMNGAIAVEATGGAGPGWSYDAAGDRQFTPPPDPE
jgi:hypothetical protein